MAAWFTVLKASLPYVTQIVTTAIPAFTSKPEASKIDPVVAKQIEELQSAATKNAESTQGLAERLQQTIQGIEAAATNLQKQVATFKVLLFSSFVISLLALATSVWAVTH
ncbi:hypothetical protein ACVCL3_10835 [Rhodanobacter sp. UC4437_H4]